MKAPRGIQIFPLEPFLISSNGSAESRKMVKFKSLIVLVWFLFLTQLSYAADNPKIVRKWKLVSFEAEIHMRTIPRT